MPEKNGRYYQDSIGPAGLNTLIVTYVTATYMTPRDK